MQRRWILFPSQQKCQTTACRLVLAGVHVSDPACRLALHHLPSPRDQMRLTSLLYIYLDMLKGVSTRAHACLTLLIPSLSFWPVCQMYKLHSR